MTDLEKMERWTHLLVAFMSITTMLEAEGLVEASADGVKFLEAARTPLVIVGDMIH